MTGSPQFDQAALARAVVMLSRYTADVTQIALQSLGRGDIENRDVQFLLAIHEAGSITPKTLAATSGTAPSVVSRALRRLEEAGLVARTQDPGDRRSVLITVTGKGRRRVTAFSGRLANSFAVAQPLFKDTLHELGFPAAEPGGGTAADPLVVAAGLARAGAAFVEEAREALEPYQVRDFAERFTLTLVFLNGTQRPTQIADELGFTLSGTSGVLTRLEAAGLITRRHDATSGDRRAVTLELTARGEAAVGVELSVFARHAEALAAALSMTCGA